MRAIPRSNPDWHEAFNFQWESLGDLRDSIGDKVTRSSYTVLIASKAVVRR